MEAQSGPQPSRPSRVRIVLKWICRVVFLLVAVVLFLVLSLPRITNLSPVRGAVARGISSRLNGGEVRLRTLRLAPLDGRLLEVRGLTLAPPGEPDRPVFLLREMTCRWDPFSLWRGTVCLTDVRVSGVRVRLEKREGRWNFMRLWSDEPSEPWPEIAALRLPVGVRLLGAAAEDIDVRVEKGALSRAGMQAGRARAYAWVDPNLRGEGRVWLGTESLQAQPGGPAQVGGTAEWATTGSLRREEADLVAVSLDTELTDVRGILEQQAVEIPEMAAELGASLNLTDFSVPEGTARLGMGEVTSVRSEFRLATGDEWELEAETDGEVDLEAMGRLAGGTLELLGGLGRFVTGAELAELSLGGRLVSDSHLRAEMTMDEGLPVRGRLENRALLERVEADVQGSFSGAGEDPASVSATVRGLEGRHEYTLEFSCADRLEVRTSESFSGSCGRIAVAAGENGSFAVENAVVSGSATDRLADSLEIELGLEARADTVLVEHPSLGRIGQPLDFSVSLSGQELLRPEASVIEIDRVEGRLGDVVSAMHLSGVIEGLGKKALSLDGSADMDLGRALELREGLVEKLAAALSGVEAVGRMSTDFEISGAVPDEAGEALRVAATTSVQMEEAEVERGKLHAEVGESHLGGTVAFDVGPALAPEEIEWTAKGRIRGAGADTVKGSGDVEQVRFDCAGTIGGPDYTELELRYEADLSGISATPAGEGPAEQVRLAVPGVSTAGEARIHPLRGDFRLEGGVLRVTGEGRKTFEVSVPELAVGDFGAAELRGKASLEVREVAMLLALVPPAYAEGLPRAAGALHADLEFDGPLPLVKKMIPAHLHGEDQKQMPEIPLLPLERSLEALCPRQVEVGLRLDNFSFIHSLAPGKRMGAQNLGGRMRFARDGESLRTDLGLVGDQVMAPGHGKSLGRVALESRVELEGYDRLRVSQTSIRALDGAVSAGLEADVSGLSALREAPTVGWMLSNLNAGLRGDFAVKPDVLTELFPGWEGSGEAGFEGEIELAGGRDVGVDFTGKLTDFALRAGEFFGVEGLNARMPFVKRWDLRRPGPGAGGPLAGRPAGGREGEAPAQSVWRRGGLDPGLGRLVEPDPDVAVDSISMGGKTLAQDIRLDARRIGAGVELSRVRLGILGGKVLGRMAGWATGEGMHVRMEAEYDGIDTRELLPERLTSFPGDSTLTGNARVGLDMEMSPGGRPIKDISARLNVTRIGPRALDRALQALDPEAENPGIVRIRTKLALAKPRRVEVELERGFLRLGVDLYGVVANLVTHYSVPRFNIAGLLGRDLTETSSHLLARLRVLNPVLDALAADRIVVDEETGELNFVRTPAFMAGR